MKPLRHSVFSMFVFHSDCLAIVVNQYSVGGCACEWVSWGRERVRVRVCVSVWPRETLSVRGEAILTLERDTRWWEGRQRAENWFRENALDQIEENKQNCAGPKRATGIEFTLHPRGMSYARTGGEGGERGENQKNKPTKKPSVK